MLVVISPAKRLDWSAIAGQTTAPRFQAEAARLAGHARQLTLGNLKSLMDLSDELARLNRDRFRAFAAEPEEEVTRPALHAFAGDTYIGLDAASLDHETVRYAQDHLRILSGLYGVLRPLDAIQAYRLEMGSRLKTRRGSTLYDFWGKEIAKALRGDAAAVGATTVVNCASQEYFGAVDAKALGLEVITPSFLEDRGGQVKIVSFFAKKARGAMARFVLERRVTTPDGLRDFDTGGYAYCPERSTATQPVFVRDYPETA
ncbi:MAG: peroxide stress protein YaaA [Pseudomonadota bacterium]